MSTIKEVIEEWRAQIAEPDGILNQAIVAAVTANFKESNETIQRLEARVKELESGGGASPDNELIGDPPPLNLGPVIDGQRWNGFL